MKKQVLNIDFKEDQGVILNWNYSDLSRKTKYFRHVIVLATGDSAEAQAFLEDYIKLIKPGDLFTAIYKPRFQQIKFKEWREKTYGHNFSPRSYLGLEEI
jgi:hypothetical protein